MNNEERAYKYASDLAKECNEPSDTYHACRLAMFLSRIGIECDIRLYKPERIQQLQELGGLPKNVKPVWVQFTRALGCQVVANGYGHRIAHAMRDALIDIPGEHFKLKLKVAAAIEEAVARMKEKL